MLNAIRQFVKEEDGLAASEYAIMLGLVAVALIAVVVTFRQSIEGVFTRTSGTLDGVNPAAS
jgi:pilus assembly protein Flp/PilA